MLDFERLETYDVTREMGGGVWEGGVEDMLISEVVDKSGQEMDPRVCPAIRPRLIGCDV
jgi:hypothetical protein